MGQRSIYITLADEAHRELTFGKIHQQCSMTSRPMADLSNHTTRPMPPKPQGPYSASVTKPASAMNTTRTGTTNLAHHNEETSAGVTLTLTELSISDRETCAFVDKKWREIFLKPDPLELP